MATTRRGLTRLARITARLTGAARRQAARDEADQAAARDAELASHRRDFAYSTFLREEITRREAQAREWSIALLPIDDRVEAIWALAQTAENVERAEQYDQLIQEMEEASLPIVAGLRSGALTTADIAAQLERWRGISLHRAAALADNGEAVAVLSAPITPGTAEAYAARPYAEHAVDALNDAIAQLQADLDSDTLTSPRFERRPA